MTTSLFDDDCAVSKTAERLGMEVSRVRPIVVTDRKAIDAAGLMRKSPDYPRIRALLNSGAKVPGAFLGPLEYILRRPGVTEEEVNL